ncbi:DEKNAAC101127 [Brettanomyces naardenensis]|uniref:DEKNAAC101127 n=1 Tax=Brettanomyces naardenensis TaxID=13370 RepID=A0A448YHJ8_BRENA|nr:DEKNAAC101127 [Brettanomyces naardenensis]
MQDIGGVSEDQARFQSDRYHAPFVSENGFLYLINDNEGDVDDAEDEGDLTGMGSTQQGSSTHSTGHAILSGPNPENSLFIDGMDLDEVSYRQLTGGDVLGLRQPTVTIPEFALDSDFFDFLYTVCENEEASLADRRNRTNFVETGQTKSTAYDAVESTTTTTSSSSSSSSSPGYFNESQYDSLSIREDILHIVENYRQRRQIIDDRRYCDNYAVDQSLIDKYGGQTEDDYMDRQGLIWKHGGQRSKVFTNRQNTFGSYTHMYRSIGAANKEVDYRLRPLKSTIFEFDKFYTLPKLKLVHFQLRNLMTSFNHREIYYASVQPDGGDYTGLMKLNTADGSLEVASTESGYLDDDDFKISMLTSSKDNYVAAGSFDGSMMVYFPHSGETQRYQISQETNRIINYVLASENPQFLTDLVIASNDKWISIFDLVKGKKTNKVKFDHPVNCIAENPNSCNELLLVGDSRESLIVDKRQSNNVPVYSFAHHHDYSFACDWNSNHLLATGNQDSTVRIYDDRSLSTPLSTVCGFYNGAVRNLKFSKGPKKFLSFAESIDNVYLIDLAKCQSSPKISLDSMALDPAYQLIDFFGKIGGLDFNAIDDGFGEELTIGISDKSVGGIMRYKLDEYSEASGAPAMDWI